MNKPAQRIHEAIKSHPRVLAVYLFGSRAYGKPSKRSDYDVGILFREDYSLDDLLDVTIALARGLDVDYDSLDVVALNDVRVELAFEVIAKGKLVYSASEEARVEFEVRVMREYIDLKPYLELYDRLMLERLSKGASAPTAR